MKRCKCKLNCFVVLGNVNCKTNINEKKLSELNICVKKSSEIQWNYIKLIIK